jgi:flagellar protein FliJ
MARFKFKLAGVLRHRRQIEQQKQRDLAVAQAQVRQTESELRALNDSMQTTSEDVRRNRLVGKLDLGFLAAHRRYLVAVQQKGRALAQRLLLQQRSVDAARQVLAEAAKQRKIIEKLRERRWEEWVAEQGRKETAELDEISQQMAFARPLDDESDV